MKILSDFDGVVTHLDKEAERVREIFTHELGQLANLSNEGASGIVQLAEQIMTENPTKHGWRSQGRITAYADEDHFIKCNALGECLDSESSSREELRPLQTEVQKSKFESFSGLAQFAYQEMTRETHTGALQPIDPIAITTFQRLLDEGNEIVVVSNSGTERILKLLEGGGLSAVAHDEDPTAQFRVRGDARKYQLDSTPREFEFGEHRIDVARSKYETIIREEKPAVVVGDVFSLDLALPLYLAKSEPSDFGDLKLFLRVRDYTPLWSRTSFSKQTQFQNSATKFFLIDDFSDLPNFLSKR